VSFDEVWVTRRISEEEVAQVWLLARGQRGGIAEKRQPAAISKPRNIKNRKRVNLDSSTIDHSISLRWCVGNIMVCRQTISPDELRKSRPEK